MSDEFREIIKERARGPSRLGPLEPGLCERAMALILAGEATPAQIGGFLLVGRAAGDTSEELAAYTRAARSLVREIKAPDGPPVVTVAGGFDGKLRTLNVGAAASLVASAAGGRIFLVGSEDTPPKAGRTVFDALRGLGVPAPQALETAEESLAEYGFAATSLDLYLPEMHDLLGLRREMVRRTALNVVEKLLSPVSGSRSVVGITHTPFLEIIASSLVNLGVRNALVLQAIEGSDEAPLDGRSRILAVREGVPEEMVVAPESLGLARATKADIPWTNGEDETRSLLAALDGEDGPVKTLLLYNAALRLWTADLGAAEAPLADYVERAREAVESGAALNLLSELRRTPRDATGTTSVFTGCKTE